MGAVVAEAASGDRIAFDYAHGATNITLSTTVQINADVTLDGGTGVMIRGNHLEVMAGCEVAFENLIFTRSTDCGYGGAVMAASGARITIIGSNVTDNKATYQGADVYNSEQSTVNSIGSYCKDTYGSVSGTTDLKPVPGKTSLLVSTDVKAIGSWYSQVVDAFGTASLQLNAEACPRFAAKAAGQSVIEVTDEEYVTMKVENVKPYLYYGLGWADTPGGEFVVEPGLLVQADGDGNLPSDVKAPKGNGTSRFFRVKVTDDPSIAQ